VRMHWSTLDRRTKRTYVVRHVSAHLSASDTAIRRNCVSDCGRQYVSVRSTGGRLTGTFAVISLDELVPSALRRVTHFA
jgi:hypothetical protein